MAKYVTRALPPDSLRSIERHQGIIVPSSTQTHSACLQAFKGDEVVYLQVTNNMESDGTRERELRPLMTIKDNHPKYIVVGNPMVAGNIDGVRCVYIGDFLLEMENNTLN